MGGTDPASTTWNRGTEHTLAVNLYTNGNAVFLGWNTSPDGQGTMFPEGAGLTPSENMTLYAVWRVPNGVDLGGGDGDPSGGVEVPVDVPGLEPGTEWELDLIPKNPPGDPIPLDKGTVDPEGEAHGGGELPPGLPEGEYEIEFTAKDPDGGTTEIIVPFEIDPQGNIANKGATVRVALADTTGHRDDLFSLSAIGVALALGGTVILSASRRRRSQR